MGDLRAMDRKGRNNQNITFFDPIVPCINIKIRASLGYRNKFCFFMLMSDQGFRLSVAVFSVNCKRNRFMIIVIGLRFSSLLGIFREKNEFSQNARKYAEKHFDISVARKRFEAVIDSVDLPDSAK